VAVLFGGKFGGDLLVGFAFGGIQAFVNQLFGVGERKLVMRPAAATITLRAQAFFGGIVKSDLHCGLPLVLEL
jgi:hypothetical protein